MSIENAKKLRNAVTRLSTAEYQLSHSLHVGDEELVERAAEYIEARKVLKVVVKEVSE